MSMENNLNIPNMNNQGMGRIINPQEYTYIQQPTSQGINETVLNSPQFYLTKQGDIIQNIVNARMYKTERVDPEHNMLVAFDEGIQDRFIEKEDEHYLDSVSNYPTMLKQQKVAELTNINTRGELKPLNSDTLTVLKDLNKVLGVFHEAALLEARIKEAGEDMVLLGDGYTTVFEADSPLSLKDNFRDRKFLQNGAQIASRSVDARRMLLDPTALGLHSGEYCSEEGRVTLNYVKQVIATYYGNNQEMMETIYRNVRAMGTPTGSRDFKTAEFLEDDGRYTSLHNVVILYIYYEKRYDPNKNKVVIDRYYIANEQIIGYDSNIGTRFPYANWRAFPRRDTPYSQSYIAKILPIQKVIDQIDAITLTIGLQTATPSMVINDIILGHYTDAEIAEIYVAGNILRGKFPAGGTSEVSKTFNEPDIPAQLLALRDRLEQDQLKILTINNVSQGNTGSLQKTGAVEQVIAETKKVDTYALDTKGIEYLKQLHYMLMELAIDIIGRGDEELVVPDVTAPEGYSALAINKADVTKLAYDFKFNLDTSARDKQANDEAIMKDLMQMDMQYGDGDPVRIILPEEILKASSLSPEYKNDILERIQQDREAAAKLLQQQQAAQTQPQPAQAANIQPQAGGIPPELMQLLGEAGASPIDSLVGGGPETIAPPPQEQIDPAMLQELALMMSQGGGVI